jgi:hypothetical protein
MRFFATIFTGLWLIPLSSTGQVFVEGRVYDTDSSSVLSFAALQLFEGKQMLAYAISDHNGYYQLKSQKTGNFWIKVSILGYRTDSIAVLLPNAARYTLDIYLREKVTVLDQVMVKANELGLKISGDTIRYDLNILRRGNEVTLGELISRLPGVEVDGGKITVNGKALDKLLVNGQEIFGNYQNLTMEHIQANAVDGIEYYENFRDRFTLRPNDETGISALNVQLKEDYDQKIMGNIELGAGYAKRYHNVLNASVIGKNSHSSAMVASRNTEIPILHFRDLLRFTTPGEGAELSIDPRLAAFVKPVENQQQAHQHMGIFNIEKQFSNQLRIQFLALLSYQRFFTQEKQSMEFFTPADTFINILQDKPSQDFLFGQSFIKLDYKPREALSIHYSGYLNGIVTERNNYITRQSAFNYQIFDEFHQTRPVETSHTLKTIQNFGKKWHWQNKVLYNRRVDDNLTQILSDDPLNFEFSKDSDRFSQPERLLVDEFAFQSVMQFKINNSRVGIVIENENNKVDYSSHINDLFKSSIESEPIVTNHLNVHRSYFSGGLQYQFISSKLFINLKPELRLYRIESKLLTNSEKLDTLRWIPSFEVRYTFGPAHNIQLSYKEALRYLDHGAYTSEPYIENFQGYSFGQVPLNSFNYEQRFNFRYFRLQPLKGNIFFVNAGWFRTPDFLSFDRSTINNVLISERIMGPDKGNYQIVVFGEKRIRRIPLAFRMQASYLNHYFQYYNETFLQTNRVHSIMLRPVLSSNFDSPLNFRTGLDYRNDYLYSGGEFNTEVAHISPYFLVQTSWKSGLGVEGSFQYHIFRNPPLYTEQNLLGFGIRWKKPKTSWQYGLRGWNILNFNSAQMLQSKLIGNVLNRNIQYTMPGFIMVSVIWHFRE